MTARRIALAAAGLLLAGACSGIPSDGPVVVVDPRDAATVASPGRVDPAPPEPGSSPRQVVRDFVDAMQAYPVSTDVAREYLSADAVESWDPSQATVVYESADFGEAPGGVVDMQVMERARLGPLGTYTPSIAGQQRVGVQWRLVLEDGEWRIDNAPDALFVSADYFQDYYRAYHLYFLDPSQRVAVGEPAYFPSGDQLATNLVRALLAGPSVETAPHVRTAIPTDGRLEVAIPVGDDGVAEVRLTAPDEQLSELQAELLSVQVVSTLQQVPGVLGVRIVVNDKPLEVGGRSEIQDVSAWNYYNPTANQVQRRLFAFSRGRLVTVEGAFVAEVDAPIGQRRQGLKWVLVQESTQLLVGVTRDGRRITSGSIDSEVGVPLAVAQVQGTDLGRPTLDRTGAVAVIDRSALGSSLVLVTDPGTTEARRVSLGPLSSFRVETFTISPDGMRFAAVRSPRGSTDPEAPSQLVTGWLERGRDGQISGVSGVQPLVLPGEQLADVRDAGWLGGGSLAVIGRFLDSPFQVYTVRIDGSALSGGQVSGEPLPEVLDPVLLAAAGLEDAPLYVEAADGSLWVRDDDSAWRSVTDAERVRSAAFAD